VGDFNGDGLPDAIISAEYGGFQLQGRSYILFGSPELGATIRDLDMTQDGATHMRITGEHAGDAAGYGKGIGDINGDGYSDVIILGSYYETKMSKAHVIFGEREPPSAVDMLRLAERGFEILAPEGVAIQGATQSNSSISVVGSDLDGDGQQDLAIPYRTALGEGILVVFGPLVSSGFLRGDANDDGRVDISDSVRILSHLFLGADPSVCRQAMDANDSGTLDLSDAVFLLNGLFQGGPAPPPPYPEPGEDPSPDAIDC
jgi:hypothetical protein